MRLYKVAATVEKILFETDDYQLITTRETERPAYVFKKFCGCVKPGNKVILNTTATRLNLGTGGYDFVICILSESCSSFEDERSSHLIKLNYTPYQFSIPVVEETEDYLEALRQFEKFKKLKSSVAALSIHSHLLPFLLGLKSRNPDVKTAVVLDDSNCLPAFLSSVLNYIKDNMLADAVITVGQAFGGTHEAINHASAFIYASFALKASIIVTAPGFGLKGTGSRFGHSAIKTAEVLFYADNLGARPYLVPRISFADSRERHYGLSHHTVEIAELKKSGFHLLVPEINHEAGHLIFEKAAAFKELVLSFSFDEQIALSKLKSHENMLKSMGRGLKDDPYFFIVPFACGYHLGGEPLEAS